MGRKSKIPEYYLAGIKQCACCKAYLSLDNFKTARQYRKDKVYEYLYSYCFVCASEKERHRWDKLSKADQKEKWLKRKYDISFAEYEDIFLQQGGKCQTCNKNIHIETVNDKNSACVDHCHRTGKIRGLLCNHCNRALGLLKEDVSTITNILNYIKEHNG